MKIKKGDYLVKCTTAKSHYFTVGESYKIIDGIICTDQGGYKVLSEMDSKFTKLYTIQDLRDGKVAVVNNGTLGDLNKVLVYTFEDEFTSSGDYRYYYENDGEWRASDDVSLPTQSVKDFLAQLPKKEEAWEPEVGEIVEFKNFSSSTEWRKSEYLATDKGSSEPYALVYTTPTGSRFIITSPIIRQIPKKVKVTKQEIADKMGIELNQLEII